MPFNKACKAATVTTTQTIVGAHFYYGCVIKGGTTSVGTVVFRKLNSTGAVIGGAITSTTNGMAGQQLPFPIATEGSIYVTVSGTGAEAGVLLDGYTTIS